MLQNISSTFLVAGSITLDDLVKLLNMLHNNHKQVQYSSNNTTIYHFREWLELRPSFLVKIGPLRQEGTEGFAILGKQKNNA